MTQYHDEQMKAFGCGERLLSTQVLTLSLPSVTANTGLALDLQQTWNKMSKHATNHDICIVLFRGILL